MSFLALLGNLSEWVRPTARPARTPLPASPAQTWAQSDLRPGRHQRYSSAARSSRWMTTILNADAIAITGDKIVAVGTQDEARAAAGASAALVNLDGRTLMPGLMNRISIRFPAD